MDMEGTEMLSNRTRLEIAHSREGIVAAYANQKLDGARKYRLRHSDGAIDAFVGPSDSEIMLPCGHVPRATCDMMRACNTIICVRSHLGGIVATTELPLEHV